MFSPCAVVHILTSVSYQHRLAHRASPFPCQGRLATDVPKVHSRINSPQGGQVHYTDAAAGHQMTVGGFYLQIIMAKFRQSLLKLTGALNAGA